MFVRVPRSLRERRISPVLIDTARSRSPSRSKSAQLLESEPGMAKSAVWTGVKAGPAVPAVPPPAMPVDRTAQDRIRISSSRMMRTPEDGGDQKSSEIRSEEHTSELQSLMRISYAVFCLKKKNKSDTYNT